MDNTERTAYATVPHATPCDAVCSVEGCGTLFGDVHKVIRITLEELAMLAGLATADTEEAAGAPAGDRHPAGYALLLDNSLSRR